MSTAEQVTDSQVSRTAVLNALRRQLALIGMPNLDYSSLEECTHLIDEVGLDSLKFVDLTVGIEEAFGLAEFPMQEWIDEQLVAGRPLTLGELARSCEALLR